MSPIRRDITSHGCRHWSGTLFPIAVAASLAACSSIADPPQLTQAGPPDLSAPTVINYLKAAAAQAKLQPPLEISAPIPAPANSSIPWIVCLRSGATEQTKRWAYSVFFKDNELNNFRYSATVERCESQTFRPL